jgi:mannitol 2-dehydrogenase
VHIGVGNFHRAHQAWYLHRLMQAGVAHDWAILGAGVREYDCAMRAKLLPQDCLTTLIELQPLALRAEIVGSMIDYLPVAPGNGPLIARLADPAIRIVSLTVTEGGYFVDATSGGFDGAHDDILFDAAHCDTPRTPFGAIIAGLKRRRELGIGPLSILSCDNLQGNGTVTRQAVVELARLSSRDLADWIEQTCTFPNSMVDCIVPATGDAERTLARSLGVQDSAPVTHEDFRQWVIEDTFCAGRPDFEAAGALFSNAVHAHEAMKLRVLNAGHQLLANAGEVLALPMIADCMGDRDVRSFFMQVEQQEILPFVGTVPGTSGADYLALIGRRFSNTAIKDTTRRVAFDGSSRHPGFVLPSLHDGLLAGWQVDGLCLSQALWARMCFGTREDGSQIMANDPHWPSLQKAAQAARERPEAWLELVPVYGDLATAEGFVASFTHWLSLIWSQGTRAALQAYAHR